MEHIKLAAELLEWLEARAVRGTLPIAWRHECGRMLSALRRACIAEGGDYQALMEACREDDHRSQWLEAHNPGAQSVVSPPWHEAGTLEGVTKALRLMAENRQLCDMPPPPAKSTKPDSSKKYPRSERVSDALDVLNRGLAKNQRPTHIIREHVATTMPELKGSQQNKEVDNLLRQLRNYRHLWNEPD